MSNPFEYLNSINESKENMMRGTENDELGEKGYNPFMTNRGLSYFRDTVILANEMNRYHEIDNIMQYEFYLHMVKPRKRYSKWFKAEKSEVLDVLVEYYQCSYSRAREYARVLTDEQIDLIRLRMTKGG